MGLTATSNGSNNTYHESENEEADFDMALDRKFAIEILKDCNGRLHSAMKLKIATSQGETTKGKKYINPRQCVECGKLTRVHCYQCGLTYCYPLKDKKQIRTWCFYKHVKGICKLKKRTRTRNESNK